MSATGRPGASSSAPAPSEDADEGSAAAPARREREPPDPDAARAKRRRTRLRIALFGALILATLTLLIVLGHPDRLWSRVRHGQASWLALAAGVEVISLLGYALSFHVLVGEGTERMSRRFSLEVTFAGVVATKLIAAFGAGGVALNVWALRAAGLAPREIAERIVSLMVTLYAVFMAALLLTALGLWSGILAGSAPTALTLIPALIGVAFVLSAAALLRAPMGVARALKRASRMRRPFGPAARLAGGAVDAGRRGMVRAVRAVRDHPQGLVGAILYWGCDATALWASVHAFGSPPALDGVIVSYFVAQLLGALPVPGGVGVVDGGLAGALIAFGASGTLAVVGVITYRFISYWLPTIPGAIAYASLLRRVEAWRQADEPEPAAVEA
ncbi:MAG TPA: lysylphosphatidylglycerol synthase transmembrane domain-containing protein [Solirubrobacteraceae bacterium]|nr:lysylphosphatidylglycerol synthase transmembrane domain-containing protein [Solirubrobacteraceae bacterium]